jgi:hypothetical protein
MGLPVILQKKLETSPFFQKSRRQSTVVHAFFEHR